MYYLIGRDLDADGQYEFIKDMDKMILTEDPASALQITEEQLEYIDMAYLNAVGFYALEADRFQVSILEKLLFSPMMMGYRPPVVPPPRPRHRTPPPPHHAPRKPAPPRPRRSPLGMLGAMFAPEPKHERHPGGSRPAGRPKDHGARGDQGRGPGSGAGHKPGGRGHGR